MKTKTKELDFVASKMFAESTLPQKVLDGELLTSSELQGFSISKLSKLAELYHTRHEPPLVIAKEKLAPSVLKNPAEYQAGDFICLDPKESAKETLTCLAKLRLQVEPRVAVGLSANAEDEKLYHLSFWFGANLVTKTELLEQIKKNSLFAK